MTSTGPASGEATVGPSSDPDLVFTTLRDHGSPGLALAARLLGRSAHEVSAEGAWVTLSDGRRLVDLGSYAVTLLGHRHPSVVAAVTDQLARMPTSTRLLANPATARFAAELSAAVGLPRVWLGSNGADAVEAALKLARRGTGRPRVLAVEGGFHGKSLGAVAATANPLLHAGLAGALSPVTHIDPDDDSAVARACSAQDVAALILEPVQGEGGVRALPPAVLRRWAADARAAGAFVISDEVQCGLGRCGPVSLARDAGLEPDAVLFGKPLGGGVMPLSALVATDAFYAPLLKDATYHSLTFGGHPLACAAGSAALVALAGLRERGSVVAAAFSRELTALATAFPDVVAEVRGRGLLWGLEARTPALAGELLLFLAEHGVIASPCLSAPSVLRLCPPLVLTDADLAEVFARLRRSLVATREVLLEEAR